MEPGTLSVLSAGAGDLRFSFNKENPREVERAAKVVTDLLRQGYAIVATDEHGGHYMVRGFDPETSEYIVVGEPEPGRAEQPVTGTMEYGPELPGQPRKRRGRPPGKRIPAGRSAATAIAPQAGG